VRFREIMPLALLLFGLGLSAWGCAAEEETPTPAETQSPEAPVWTPVELPPPRSTGDISVEQALQQRRSIRAYAAGPLTIAEVSQLLWSAQGITADWGGRTAPSAGALYPLEVYLVAGDVENMSSGVYRYDPAAHSLIGVKKGDFRAELAAAALGQESVRLGAVDIVISAVYERTTRKYGDRGIRYVHMEAGHAAQNLYLQATSLGLGMVTIGAFYDNEVKQVLALPEDETALYIIPVGRLP
jgi:SagB-type dehydrogenase family enzyme